MNDAGAQDDVEPLAERRQLQQIALQKAQIGQAVPLLQEALVRQRGLGQVDADHLVVPIHERRVGCLDGPASGDENLQLPRRFSARPEDWRIARRITDLTVPAVDRFLEVRERLRIGERLILPRHQARYVFHRANA